MRRWLALVAFAVVVILVTSVIIAARFARPLAERFLTDVIGAPVSVGVLAVHTSERRVVAKAVTIGPPEAQLAVTELSATIALGPLLRGDIVVSAARLAGLTATVEVDPSYRVTVAGLPVPQEKQPAASSGRDAPTRVVTIDQLSFTDATLTVRHALQGKPQQVAVRVDELTARDTSVRTDGSGLRLDADLRATADGIPLTAHVGLTPDATAQRVDVRADLGTVGLPHPLVALPPALSGLAGKLSGSLSYHRAPASKEEHIDVDLQLDAPRLSGRAGSRLAARTVAVDGLRVDFTTRAIDIGTVAVDQLAVALAWTPDGIVLPFEAPEGAASRKGDAQWKLAGGTVSVKGGTATLLRNRSQYELAIDSAHWEGIASGSAGSLDFNARSADGGGVTVSGAFGFDPGEIGLTVTAKGLAIASTVAVLPELPLRIARGTASGTFKLNGPLDHVAVQGDVSLDQVYTEPPATHSDQVLAVHRVEAQISVDPERRHVEVASLKIRYPYMMVQRTADGIFPYSSFGGVEDGPRARHAASTTVRIKALEIEGGRADFLDRVVAPNYWTALASIVASARPLALPGLDIGDFRVAALQDEIAPVEVTGTVQAEGWHLQADLQAVFLPSLNTYIAPLLGYKVESGILSLNIDGRVSADDLRTKNSVTLRNVTLSQTGLDVIQRDTGVPLPIALALLKDTGGTIELAVPVHGNPRARQFAIGSLINQALGKAIQGALSAPLKLLGLLFGTKGPPRALAIDPIPFAAGSAALEAAAGERLGQIAHILAAHTEVTLVAKPEVSAQDVAVVGSHALERLAAQRAEAVTTALCGGHIQPELPRERLVMVPWKAERDGGLSERSGMYVEMQLSADYGR